MKLAIFVITLALLGAVLAQKSSKASKASFGSKASLRQEGKPEPASERSASPQEGKPEPASERTASPQEPQPPADRQNDSE